MPSPSAFTHACTLALLALASFTPSTSALSFSKEGSHLPLPLLARLASSSPASSSLSPPTSPASPLLHARAVAKKHKKAVKARAVAAPTTYANIVAFGASYTDNAHERPAAYASSKRNYYPYSMYGGRYTNGPVAVEYLTTLLPGTPKLLDYAYGGSQIDNSLTGGSSPASKDQVAQYLSDLSRAGTSAAGRTLHVVNTGINPLTVIWNDCVSQGMTSQAISKAQARVTANVKAIATQMRSINTNASARTKLAVSDFLIAGIPALEIVPSFNYASSGSSSKLTVLKQLSNSFNSQLRSFAVSFAPEVSAAGKGGRVAYYDMQALWYDYLSRPGAYGVTAGLQTCYNSVTGAVCGNPQNYQYFDSLHPTTQVMNVIANGMAAALR